MNPKYDPVEFETKWQVRWKTDRTYSTKKSRGGETCYVLDMFPYPSGNSMHVGHPRGYVATDAYSRMKRMLGFRVLHPMGWDAFGLPAEETAIANQEYPAITVEKNIDKFKSQLCRLGIGYDWDREINTTDPAFYRHTQRIFLEMFRLGLAYYETSNVNWCAALGTVLANEDIVDGRSERGGHPVIQQPMRQWTLRITAYAERLADDLDLLPKWPDRVKNAQRNWIGKSVGHTLRFKTTSPVEIEVFTTRIDTLGGVTFMAVAANSGILDELKLYITNAEAVHAYVEEARRKTERDRTTTREKTAQRLEGVAAINPITGEEVPILVADYVLANYGSGAVMGVPAHDERDEEMAKALKLQVIPCVADGKLLNSGQFDGLDVETARRKISEFVGANEQMNFKMRDWVFSRQRFWGEPFPIVWVVGEENYRKIAGGPAGSWMPEKPITYEQGATTYFAVPITPENLKDARLPVVASYKPTGEPTGPLGAISEWVNVEIDPASGSIRPRGTIRGAIPASRETNTMPQWAGSSWYWLRFMDPHNSQEPFSRAVADEWGPVDVYAGADHAVAHLIYARFWHKVLYDLGYVSFSEPFDRLEFLGYVLAADGTKISKRSGNSRSPDDVINEVGADAFRMYEMAIGPFEKAVPWIDGHLAGMRRFLDRFWQFCHRTIEANADTSDDAVTYHLNFAIKKVSEDIEAFKFNTAVTAVIVLLNECGDKHVSLRDLDNMLKLLAPFAPHLAEEVWRLTGHQTSIHLDSWPNVNEAALVRDTYVLPIQVNGKKRAEIVVPSDAGEDFIKAAVLNDPNVQKWIEDKAVKKFKFIQGRIANVVV